MSDDISGISGSQKLTSKLKVSLESTQKTSPLDSAPEMEEIKQFEIEMAHAISLAREIQLSLESALKNLS
jgi:hypothetical protein